MIAKRTHPARQTRACRWAAIPSTIASSTHFGGALIPTVLGTWAKFEADGKAEDLAPEDVMFKGNGVYCMELGGPESARGCGGRGITFGFQMLEKWGLSEWNFHYMLLDFLGDVVCGGFGTPIARSMADKLIIVCSNERPVDVRRQQHRLGGALLREQRRAHENCLGLVRSTKTTAAARRPRMAAALGVPVLAQLPQIPQKETVPRRRAASRGRARGRGGRSMPWTPPCRSCRIRSTSSSS